MVGRQYPPTHTCTTSPTRMKPASSLPMMMVPISFHRSTMGILTGARGLRSTLSIVSKTFENHFGTVTQISAPDIPPQSMQVPPSITPQSMQTPPPHPETTLITHSQPPHLEHGSGVTPVTHLRRHPLLDVVPIERRHRKEGDLLLHVVPTPLEEGGEAVDNLVEPPLVPLA